MHTRILIWEAVIPILRTEALLLVTMMLILGTKVLVPKMRSFSPK